MKVSIYKSNNLFYLNGAIVPINRYRGIFETINNTDVLSIEDIRERTHLLTRFPITSISKENGQYYTDKSEFITDCGSLFCNIITGFATSANQTNGTQKTQIVDASGNVIGSQLHGSDYYLLASHKDLNLSDTITGLNDSAEMNLNGMGSAFVQVGGTWSGKIDIQGAIDGIWNTLSIFQPTGQLIRTGINNDAQNGLYRIVNITGYTKLRAIFTSYTSGTATIYMNASIPVGSNQVWQLNQLNFLATVFQPTGTNLHTVVDSGTVTATIDKTGLATETKQDNTITVLTDKSQFTKITDADGDVLDIYERVQTPTAKVIGVQIGPGDIISKLPVTIEYDHHQIHEGESFRWSVYISSLGVNANKDIRFVVPNITIPVGQSPVVYCPHFRFEVVASGDAIVNIFEAPTYTAPGTQRTPVAMERNGTYIPKLQVYEDPTVNATGSLIWQGLNTAGKAAVGGITGSAHEFVLKNNTEYFFRVTSNSASNKVLIRFEWYEDLGV